MSEMPPGFGPNDPTASDDAETDYAPCGFKITEHPPGSSGQQRPSIMIEIDEPGLRVLKYGNSFLGLECRQGVSFEDAKRLAADLDRMIIGVSHTKFVT